MLFYHNLTSPGSFYEPFIFLSSLMKSVAVARKTRFFPPPGESMSGSTDLQPLVIELDRRFFTFLLKLRGNRYFPLPFRPSKFKVGSLSQLVHVDAADVTEKC